jgi:2'-5' RNA ligase
MTRLFVAVYPSAEAVADLRQTVAGLRSVGTRVLPEQWHVTLVFLGEVPEDQVGATCAALDVAVGAHQPFQLQVAGGGFFLSGRQVVLWAGLTGDLGALRSLTSAVRAELAAGGRSFDERPLSAHLTLSRLPAEAGHAGTPERDRLDVDLRHLAAHTGPSFTVSGVHLVQSHLGPPVGHLSRHHANVGTGP